MSRVTSKLQVTIPKAIADRHGIRPGQVIDWQSAGETIRVVVDTPPSRPGDVHRRLELFDDATARQDERERQHPRQPAASRGWTREELYDRGRAG
jgi:bifunctional DNA-binding transcriptional regulator/antitoxin component of YhaV-PrlF toxin-antitoxin module